MMSHYFSSDEGHRLLEPPSLAYTNVTVRRAFIVWIHLGQQNEFRHVCNYFHYLEALEEKLSAEARTNSRLHEFNLISDYPPTSQYLTKHFPKLYKHNKNNKIKINNIEDIKLDDCVFNLEGYHNMKIQKGVTTKDIINTSQMIKKYCKTHSKSLSIFLTEFLDYTKKTQSTNSIDNVMIYIKKKYLKDELETLRNLPKNFSFLDHFEEVKVSNVKLDDVKDNISPIFKEDSLTNGNNKIRILINESRRKELMNSIPNLSELSIKEINNRNKVVAAKLNNGDLKKCDGKYEIDTKI